MKEALCKSVGLTSSVKLIASFLGPLKFFVAPLCSYNEYLPFANYGKLCDGYRQSGLLVRQNMSHSGILTTEALLLLPLTAPLS